VKARIKAFLAAHSLVRFLVPVAQYVLGIPYELRNLIFQEILRLRLIGLWLVKRRPLLVFVRFGGIGDILCSLPAYEALCRANPNAHGVFVTLAEFECLPQLARVPGSVCSSRFHCSIPRFPRWLAAQVFIPHYRDEMGRLSSTTPLTAEFSAPADWFPPRPVPGSHPSPTGSRIICGRCASSPGSSTKTVVIHPVLPGKCGNGRWNIGRRWWMGCWRQGLSAFFRLAHTGMSPWQDPSRPPFPVLNLWWPNYRWKKWPPC